MPREYAQKTSSRLLLIKFNIVSDYSDGKKRYFAEYFRRRRVTERWPGTAGYPVDSRGQNLKRHFFSSPKEVFLEAEAHCALYLSQRTPYQQSENSASIKRAEANVKMQAEKTKAQLEQLSNEAKEVISKASLNTVEALKANASVSGSIGGWNVNMSGGNPVLGLSSSSPMDVERQGGWREVVRGTDADFHHHSGPTDDDPMVVVGQEEQRIPQKRGGAASMPRSVMRMIIIIVC
jgi:hypothetical protein